MKRTLAVSAMLGLTGCATYQARPIDPAVSISAFEHRSLADPKLRQFLLANNVAEQSRPPTWNLSALSDVALYYHPDLDVARAKWQTARAAAITAGARPNPGINTSIEYNADAPEGITPWSPGISLSIPIQTAGKRHKRIAQAVQVAEAARLDLVDAAWQVRGRVRSGLLGAIPTEPLLRRVQALQVERVRLMQRRVELGFAAQPDLTLSRIALQQATLAADEAHKRLAENRTVLAAALGLPVAALDGVELSLHEFERVPAIDILPSNEVQRQALLHRPDVLAAVAEYRASESGLQVEVAKQYPDLSLSPGLLRDAGEAKWSLGLSLVLPLLDRNQGPIAEAKARRELAAANVLVVQSRAIGEVERALAGYRAAVEKLRTADALVAAQHKKDQSDVRMQRAGEIERSMLLGTQVELAAAEQARLETLVQTQQALGALEDAIRTPLADAAPFALPETIETDPRQKDDAP